MPVEKNKEYIVDIIDNGFEGEGIAKIDGFTIFIPNAIKGEKVKILIVKVLSSHGFGKIVEIIKKSKYRVEPDCETYKRCGGCLLRHIKYDKTLEMKQDKVQNLVNKGLKNKILVSKAAGMENPYYYRNKLQFPVGKDKNQKPAIGVFANRTHEIIPVKKCLIQDEKAQEIAKDVFEYLLKNKITIYDEKNQKGLLRHINVKVGIKTNEYMLILVINGKKLISNEFEEKFIKNITEKHKEIKTIILNYNLKNTNVILGKEDRVIYGEGTIKDKLGNYYFNISPFSFYQVNPIQTEKLYKVAVESANITKKNIVFDLYSGIGTISIFMSEFAKKVYGIEIVNEAVKMANENAKINNIKNVEFIAGDVEIELDKLINIKKIVPDIIMIDPPRRGLDNKSIENIRKIKTKKLVYVSCNPATLIRDLNKLEDIYEVNKIVPVDMFPFTRTY